MRLQYCLCSIVEVINKDIRDLEEQIRKGKFDELLAGCAKNPYLWPQI